jgi:hypothetical protein
MSVHVGNEYNPEGARLHMASIPVSVPNPNVFTAIAVGRVYFPHLPVIETGQLVGLCSFVATGLSQPFGKPGNIGIGNIIPFTGSTNVNPNGVLSGGMENIFITIVNKKKEVLFNQVPYSLLFPIDGKIQPFNAVNIDSRSSYFSFPPGVDLIPNLVANLGFYMKNF